MKLPAIFLLAAFLLISCKKEYTCQCETSSDQPGFKTHTTSGSWHAAAKKDEAKAECNKGDSTYTLPNGTGSRNTYYVDCSSRW